MISIPYSQLGGASRTWLAVTGRDPAADSWFARPPASVASAVRAAKETLARPRDYARLAGFLSSAAESYGVPAPARERLKHLAEGRAVFVVTGQQVGYLGGPLFTLLKAYHAVRLAEKLEHELSLPVLPLFWLEGRDHDLEEVRHAHYLSSTGELRTMIYDPPREIPNYEVGYYPVSADDHLRELAEAAGGDSEGLETLRAAYSQTTLADGLGGLLARLLGARGLLVAEGLHPQLAGMASPLWDRIISAGPRLSGVLQERAEEMTSQGWPAPLRPTPDSYLFYLVRDHLRTPVSYAGLAHHADGTTERLSTEQIRARVVGDPTAISPKAALRPVYQDFVLPVAAYVAGPGECDYHAQLAPLYRELDVCPSAVFPRLSATLVDAKTARNLEKLGLNVPRILSEPAHVLTKDLISDEDHGRATALFEESRRRIESVFETLKTELAAVDPTLEGAAAAGAGKALHPLDQLREKTEKALKQKHSTTLARLEKSLVALKPQGRLSERVFCTGYYLARFGPERLLSALEQLPLDGKEHHVLPIEA